MGRYDRYITQQDILKLVDEEDIFRAYFDFEPNKPFCNPYRGERKPSTIIGTKPGFWYMIDLGGGLDWKGNVWKIVQKIENCDYKTSLQRIDSKMKLGILNGEYKPVKKVKKKPIIYSKQDLEIKISKKKWTKKHHEFWNKGTLSKDDLVHKDVEILAVSKLYINNKIYNEDLTFAIYHPSIDKFKIYRPYAPKDSIKAGNRKWTSNIPFQFHFNIDEIKGCETAIMTKSIKEFFLYKKYLNTNCLTTVQAENPASLSDEVIKTYLDIPNRWVCGDTDKPGKVFTQYLTDNYGFKHYNSPDNILNLGCTDAWDWVCKVGYKPFLLHLKSKIKLSNE